MMQQVAIPVTESSQIGEARRAAARLSEHADLGETQAGRVAIIVTELATNLVKYGQRGTMVMRSNTFMEGGGTVEILAIDSGPGMDSTRCATDGYSTGGTPGNGLGAVQRLAGEFDMYSSVPTGTVIMACVADTGPRTVEPGKVRWGCVCLPMAGEIMCGDSCRFQNVNGSAAMMIADGLGHGPDAATASTSAVRVFEKDPSMSAANFVTLCHQEMSGTRGAAVAIANIDTRSATLHYAGVGNITGTLYTGGQRRGLPSLNGIVGAILPKVKSYDYPLPTSGMVVMHSDGLHSRWTLDTYPGLMQRHPAVIAGVLFRDFCRGRDDVTVLVGSWQGGGS
jgi:anti-sigma regulatory factor (Ser/Thr protein kinase)